MIELVIYLPLNLIPYVGVPAYILITGYRLGTFAHYRWYKLRGLSRHERKKEIRSRAWDYLWFGTVAMLMELVPLLSFFFLLTSTSGSALWAARMEEKMRKPAAVASVPVHEPAQLAEAEEDPDAPPPPYVDNPV
jgi:uncharacterized protein involved in cysteine biosynthesis